MSINTETIIVSFIREKVGDVKITSNDNGFNVVCQDKALAFLDYCRLCDIAIDKYEVDANKDTETEIVTYKFTYHGK